MFRFSFHRLIEGTLIEPVAIQLLIDPASFDMHIPPIRMHLNRFPPELAVSIAMILLDSVIVPSFSAAAPPKLKKEYASYLAPDARTANDNSTSLWHELITDFSLEFFPAKPPAFISFVMEDP